MRCKPKDGPQSLVVIFIHGSLNVPIEHHPTIRYMVYNGYYKVMSNIPKMGQLPTPAISSPFSPHLPTVVDFLMIRFPRLHTLMPQLLDESRVWQRYTHSSLAKLTHHPWEGYSPLLGKPYITILLLVYFMKHSIPITVGLISPIFVGSILPFFVQSFSYHHFRIHNYGLITVQLILN